MCFAFKFLRIPILSPTHEFDILASTSRSGCWEGTPAKGTSGAWEATTRSRGTGSGSGSGAGASASNCCFSTSATPHDESSFLCGRSTEPFASWHGSPWLCAQFLCPSAGWRQSGCWNGSASICRNASWAVANYGIHAGSAPDECGNSFDLLSFCNFIHWFFFS